MPCGRRKEFRSSVFGGDRPAGELGRADAGSDFSAYGDEVVAESEQGRHGHRVRPLAEVGHLKRLEIHDENATCQARVRFVRMAVLGAIVAADEE